MKRFLLLVLSVSLSAAVLGAADEFPRADTPPRPLSQRAPTYPFEMRAAGLVGVVTIAFIIDEQGKVAEAFVLKSNNPWFERPALDALLEWKFSPALKGGKPVKTRARQEITFDLSGRGQDLWRIEKSKDPSKLPPDLRWEIAPHPDSTLLAVYPFAELKEGKKGKVKAAFLIDEKGRVAQAKIIETTAPEFGAAVLAMLDGWRFKPARKADGSACKALVTLEREFAPRGGDVPVSDGARLVLRRLEKKDPGIAELKELDEVPKHISRRPPVYPSSLREANVAGEALIEYYIDDRGDVQLPRIVSATRPEFGYAAAQAVATWRYAAPLKAGKPVVARTQQVIAFKLQEPTPRPPQPESKEP